MSLKSPASIVARQQSKHPSKPAGCNGWYSPADNAILHGGGTCPVHDREDDRG
jgi:hypothetical protein